MRDARSWDILGLCLFKVENSSWNFRHPKAVRESALHACFMLHLRGFAPTPTQMTDDLKSEIEVKSLLSCATVEEKSNTQN